MFTVNAEKKNISSYLTIDAVRLPNKNGLTINAIEGNHFNNYYANLPVTLSADESAGLITSANATGEPYGSNLQPNPDLSGTAGTTGGAGTVNGDVADSYNIEANTGTTCTAGKSSNDYQIFYSSGNWSKLTTAGTAIVLNEVWLAEISVSGVVNTPEWAVETSAGLNEQFEIDLTEGYNRKIFTADATFTGGIIVKSLSGEGCTIHWLRLRKLGPSSGLISEVNRTLMPNGTELVANGGFDNWTGDIPDNWLVSNCTTRQNPAGWLEVSATADNGGMYQAYAVTAGDRQQIKFKYYNTVGDIAVYSIYDVTNSTYIVSLSEGELPDTQVATNVIYEFTVPSGCESISFGVRGNSNTDIVFFDDVSSQKMQPTASLIERVSNAETLLIDHEPIVYSAGADLELVKDGLTATMFYNSLIVDAEQTIDSSLQYNVLHSTYGDLALCGAETIIPLQLGAQALTNSDFENVTLGAELSAGNLTVGRCYVITAQSDQNFTADGAADNNVGTIFAATATNVTLDATNKVQQITLDDWTVSGTRDATAYLVYEDGKLQIVSDGDVIGVYGTTVNTTLYKYTIDIDAVVYGSLKLTSGHIIYPRITADKSGYFISGATNLSLQRSTGNDNVIVNSLKLYPVKVN